MRVRVRVAVGVLLLLPVGVSETLAVIGQQPQRDAIVPRALPQPEPTLGGQLHRPAKTLGAKQRGSLAGAATAQVPADVDDPFGTQRHKAIRRPVHVGPPAGALEGHLHQVVAGELLGQADPAQQLSIGKRVHLLGHDEGPHSAIAVQRAQVVAQARDRVGVVRNCLGQADCKPLRPEPLQALCRMGDGGQIPPRAGGHDQQWPVPIRHSGQLPWPTEYRATARRCHPLPIRGRRARIDNDLP